MPSVNSGSEDYLQLPDIDNGRYVSLGIMLSRVRMRLRCSQMAISLKAEVRPQTVSEIELGKRIPNGVPMVMRLADAYEMPRQQLFTWIVKEIEHQAAKEMPKDLGNEIIAG